MKKHFTFLFTTLLCVSLAFPMMSHAQSKNLLSVHRVFPKMDKGLEFEAGLAAHAQKYHTGAVAWRVYSIQSGPDAGGYHIIEGPTSWEAEDIRGDLGEEHMKDWHKNIAMYLTEKESVSYAVYIDTLSTVALADFTDKVNITHVYPKMGKGDNVVSLLSKLRKAWAASGMTVAVFVASSSGPGQYTVVTRYKQGLKEREVGFRKPFKETYESVNGPGSWKQYLNDISEYVDNSWSELLFLRKDLGSK